MKKASQMDRRSDRQTEWAIHIAAWSQLKTIGHLSYATSSFVHHFIAISEFKLELESGNAQFGSKFLLNSVTLTFDLLPWPFAWTSLLAMVTTPEIFMMIWWWEHSWKGRTDGRTDRRMDRSVLRAAWSQLKITRAKLNAELPSAT